MITTEYVNPLQHRVFDGATLVGYVTLHSDGWLFTAANRALSRTYLDSRTPVANWQDALPEPTRLG